MIRGSRARWNIRDMNEKGVAQALFPPRHQYRLKGKLAVVALHHDLDLIADGLAVKRLECVERISNRLAVYAQDFVACLNPHRLGRIFDFLNYHRPIPLNVDADSRIGNLDISKLAIIRNTAVV